MTAATVRLEEPTMTDYQGTILLHMTGLDRSKEPYRNHFATHPGGDDHADLEAMLAEGLVYLGRRASGSGLYGDMLFYHCTEKGIAEAKRLSPKLNPAKKGAKNRCR
jgi:hypothetical protein